jgi:hypothetical protein
MSKKAQNRRNGFEHPKSMADKTYLVRFKRPEISTQPVIAASVEFHGEHLVFLDSKGELAALFLLEIVESWSESDL